MKQGFKAALSVLTIIAMLVSSAFSSIVFADDVAEDKSFTVFVDDVAANAADGVVNTGYLAGTDEAIWFNNGKNGETTLTKKDTAKVNGKEYNAYISGARINDIINGKCETIDAVKNTNGHCVIFKAPANGILISYAALPSGKSFGYLVYDAEGKLDSTLTNFSNNNAPAYAISVKEGLSYVMATSGTDSLAFAGFMFMQDAPIDVNVSFTDNSAALLGGDEVQVINTATGLTEATIKNDTTQITLTRNNSYILRSSVITKKAKTSEGSTEFTLDTELPSVTVDVYSTETVKVSGNITTDDNGKYINSLSSIIFKSMDYAGSDYTFDASSVVSGGRYTVELLPGEYETVIDANGAYNTYDHVSVPETGTVENEIYCEATGSAPANELSTGTYNLDEEIESAVSKITFTSLTKKDATYGVCGGVNATIKFPVKANQEITISGSYDGEWEIKGNGVNSTAVKTGSSSPFTATYKTTKDDTEVTITVTQVGNIASGSGSAYLKSIVVKDAVSEPIAAGTYTGKQFVELSSVSTTLTARDVCDDAYGGAGKSATFPVKANQKIDIAINWDGSFEIKGNGANSTAVTSDNTLKASYTTASDDTEVTITATNTFYQSDNTTAYLNSVTVTNLDDSQEVKPVGSGTYKLKDEISNENTRFTFENAKVHSSSESIVNSGGDATIITFKVNGAAKIKVGGWYSGTWSINDNIAVTANSTDNGSIDKCAYNEYEMSGAGTVTIKTNGTTYLTTVEVTYNNTADEPQEDYDFKKSINVPGDYDTLTQAVAAIKAMERPNSEDARVTINLTADLEEQVLMDVPYVSLNGNGHTLSWYYSTIGSYYSVDSNGYYSERLFRDKYSKNPASGSLWGGVLIVKGDYFKAYDVTLKNTFNYEVTDREIEDGGEDTVLGVRTKDMDVQTYADKERANALYTDANYGEYTNCKILSSQDTLGVNGPRSTYNYFKNCVIGGNVDYICGAGTMVFDDCELQWKTYSDVENGKNNGIGYIVAPRGDCADGYGNYVFRNCTVTTDGKEGEGTVVLGKWGRTWSGASKAYFINTITNGLVEGWGEMSTGDGVLAQFYEYNNVESFDGVTSGAAVEVTGFGKPLTDIDALKSIGTDSIISDILGGWTPTYYTAGDRVQIFAYGDATGEGSITAEDAVKVLEKVLNDDVILLVNKLFLDVDGDSELTATDAALIRKKADDSSFTFPVEKTE